MDSPDGKYIYYDKWSQPGLYRMPAQGGEETQLLQALPPGAFHYFGVTSKGVYFSPDDSKTVQFFDTATGKVSTIAALDNPVAWGAFCVSPDKAYVV